MWRRPLGALAALALATLGTLVAAPPDARAREAEIARDSGEQSGKQSLAGSGHRIELETPRGTQWIEAIRIYGARYGGGYDADATRFRVALDDGRGVPLLSFEAPYSLFAPGRFAWVEVPLPEVVLAPDRFRVTVAFDPSATRGVFVGWAGAKQSHSSVALPGGPSKPFADDKEWMIRAVVQTKPPRDRPAIAIVGVDDGTKAGYKSLGGSGHLVGLAKPPGTWWVASVLVFGQRYGGGYDPGKTLFTTGVLTSARREILRQQDAYALFPGGDFAWVEIPMRDPHKVPSHFDVGVDFDPGRTRGVYVAFSASERPHSAVGRIGEAGTPFPQGDWMIRAKLESEKPGRPVPETPTPPSPTPSAPQGGPASPAAHDPKVYLQDFESLRRTVRDTFPSFEKKGVDWDAVCRDAEPAFAACRDDRTHVLNARKLLARLGDAHSGVLDAKVDAPSPAFDGLYGAGLWIAREGDAWVLRALLPGHALATKIHPGDRLVAVDGKPTKQVRDEVAARLRLWYGWSSEHFLDARLSFQFFPFGEKRTLPARFERSGGGTVDVVLPRWGPGGRGLSRAAVSVPEGLEAKVLEGNALAVATKLEGDLGYVRILGGMDEKTRDAFFDALDTLRGVKGILLDARGAGGGSDLPAWAMAGRFFAKRHALRNDPAIEPTGGWQFEGPVVFLQDERMISSAETFTWAMVETGRALSVGRPTGGATIIPRVFEVPSGLFRYRVGARDRETSVKGIHPEGIGSPPDVFVPYAPFLFEATDDPERFVGLEALRALVRGRSKAEVVMAFEKAFAAGEARPAFR